MQLKDYEKRLSHVRDLLATQQIDAKDYREMKSSYSEIISKLESKLSVINEDKENIDDLLNSGIENLLKLHECYISGEWVDSRDLIGSIYPENFTILKNEFRTTRVNEVVGIIYLINSRIPLNKNGTKKNFSSLSHKVTSAGFEPATFRAEI